MDRAGGGGVGAGARVGRGHAQCAGDGGGLAARGERHVPGDVVRLADVAAEGAARGAERTGHVGELDLLGAHDIGVAVVVEVEVVDRTRGDPADHGAAERARGEGGRHLAGDTAAHHRPVARHVGVGDDVDGVRAEAGTGRHCGGDPGGLVLSGPAALGGNGGEHREARHGEPGIRGEGRHVRFLGLLGERVLEALVQREFGLLERLGGAVAVALVADHTPAAVGLGEGALPDGTVHGAGRRGEGRPGRGQVIGDRRGLLDEQSEQSGLRRGVVDVEPVSYTHCV